MKHNSIVESVLSYQKENPVSFHVPGHKNGRAYENSVYSLTDLDVTEIPGTDNLHHPEEAILEVKRKAASLYGSKESYLLVNGTTGGNHAMILSTTCPGDKILIARNVHKSVHTACIMGDLHPEYIYPEIHEKLGLPLGITADVVEAMLQKHSDIKAVVVTSPTYEGVHSDIESISDITRRFGVYLLVDEAHGAHVALNAKFGKSAITAGADVAVQSTHKSMCALTQASMLHVGSDRVPKHNLESWLSMLQSSSPSYVLMSSLERALADFEPEGRGKSEVLIDNLLDLRHKLKSDLNLKVLCGDDVALYGFSHDISKLVVFMQNAERIADQLRDVYAIQVEYATADFIVCVTSIWNTQSDFERLYNALKKLGVQKSKATVGLTDYPVVQQGSSPRTAFYSKTVQVDLDQSIDKICGEYVIPYPPGIPLLSPGETITKEIVALINKWISLDHAIIGTKDESLKTIRVLD